MILTQENRTSQTVSRGVQVAILELSQPEVQEQVPTRQPKRRGSLILSDFRPPVAHHSKGKTQMIVSYRIIRVLLQNLNVTTYCFRIVVDTKGIVCTDIANLRLGDASDRIAPNQKRQKEDSRREH